MSMDESQFQLVRAIGFVAAVGLAWSFQRAMPHEQLNGSWRTNATIWAVNAVVLGIVCGACACSVALWAEGVGIGLFNSFATAPWMRIAATILILDLVSYWWHRANHRLSVLWRFHQVHHSDRAFTVSTAARFHPGELLLSLPLRLSAVAALGADPLGVVAFEMIFAVANFFEHGNIDLPPAVERRLQRICITPALHRRHHSANTAELDRNFGTVFVFWDLLFSTYLASSSARRVSTGLPYHADVATLRQLFVLPLRRGAVL